MTRRSSVCAEFSTVSTKWRVFLSPNVGEKDRIIYEIPSPKPSGLHHDTPEPLESCLLEEARRSADETGHEIDSCTHSYGNGHIKLGSMAVYPFFLFWTAQADE